MSTESIHVIENGTSEPGKVRPFQFSFSKFFKFAGPGLLMSIAYIDPGNLEAAIVSGAKANYAQLWVLLISIIIGYIIQTRTINLGIVTGKHLAEHCHGGYGRVMRILLWIMAEVAIIGSDVQEVLGSAIAIRILSLGHIPLWGGTLVAAVGSMLFLLLEQVGVRHLEALFAVLISVMSVSFGVQYFTRLPPQLEVIKGIFIPRIPQGTIQQAVGTVGAVIMPHNLFLHSALVLSRKIDRDDDNDVKEAIMYNSLESGFALIISFFINLFVVANFAYLDYGKCNLNRDDVGLVNGGECLGVNYGSWALYVWAVGLLASGQSSTCTGTYAGQFVMQGFMNWKLPGWQRAIGTRAIAIIPSFLIAASLRENALDTAQEIINVLQSIQLPFALLPVMKFTMSRRIMGSHWSNSLAMNCLLWVMLFVTMAANISGVFQYFSVLSFNRMESITTFLVITLYLLLVLYNAALCFSSEPLLYLERKFTLREERNELLHQSDDLVEERSPGKINRWFQKATTLFSISS